MSTPKQTILEIDLKTLTHNFDVISSKLSSNTKCMAVIKAGAYGSNMIKIATHLQKLDIDYFAVAYTHEGVLLREAHITKPILVLHPLEANFEMLITHHLEPNLYSFKTLQGFIHTAKKKQITDYPVHLKWNTGLNRLGFSEHDVEHVASILKTQNTIFAKYIFSHLAASEDVKESEFTKRQIQTFNAIAVHFSKIMGYMPMRHMCNTSGIFNYPEAHFDMVRTGIGLYGFGHTQLKPIGSLKTIISQIHNIKSGETIGYNRAFKSCACMKIATLPIGHADGISRLYGNEKGYVIIKNKKAPIVGHVCMDMMMVDVTHIDCQEGDEVIIFNATYTAEKLSEAVDSIPYELITSISKRVKRIFYE